MASDSSSVLELNDADITDTEGPSVTDDAQEGIPLIMEQDFDIAVKVDAPMKQLSTLETFVTYRVRCVCARWPTPPYVRRRYNHFKLLHKRLAASHPLVAPPPLPPLHSARQQLDRYSPTFVAVRALALHAFLDRVAKHPILTHSEDFRIFLTTPDDELDKVFKSENSALNLWGLGSLYGSGDPKTSNGARVKDPEFTSAADYLTSLQQKLTTLCTITTKLYKGSVALSAELMSMRRACDAWAVGAGGRVCRSASACGGGAGAAAAARSRNSLRHRAQLPLLAAYAAAHAEKIRARDALHAAYISGTSSSDDIHNRLEQASEALRSELGDWMPKTRSEIKSILLELADRQVNMHSQALMGWENALKLATEDVSQMFKTVSKTAVQNLSPSKCRSIITPNETERDIDDFEIDDDSETQDRSHEYVTNATIEAVDNSRVQDFNVNTAANDNNTGANDNTAAHDNNTGVNDNTEAHDNNTGVNDNTAAHDNNTGVNDNTAAHDNNTGVNDNTAAHDNNGIESNDLNSNIPEDIKINEGDRNDPQLKTKSDLNSGISNINISEEVNVDSMSKEESTKSEVSKFSDPLQDFSDVDLS